MGAEEVPVDKQQKLRSKSFRCPHCQEMLIMHLAIELQEVITQAEMSARYKDVQVEKFTAEEKQLLTSAKASGLIKPFSDVVLSVHTKNSIPKDMEVYFLTFLRTCHQRKMPQHLLPVCKEIVGSPTLSYYASNGIGVLCTKDGIIKQFVPNAMIAGQKVKGSKFNAGAVDPDELRKWSRTKFGYVSGNGAFFQAMQKSSIGAFEKRIMRPDN